MAHPWAFAAGALVGVGGLLWWPPLGLAVWALMAASLAQELRWRARARREGLAARWVIPTSRRWWNSRLARLGLPLVPPGNACWEIHVQDDHHWGGDTPEDAARQFRVAYCRDMAHWIASRPPGVALVGSTFNRLTPEEATVIRTAGGSITAGAVHPRLAAYMQPVVYRRLQTRLFGGVISETPRHDPTRWTTWVVPPQAR